MDLRPKTCPETLMWLSFSFSWGVLFIYFFFNQQSEYKVFYELMCWLSGSLTCRLPNVMRSPPARRSLSSITVDWCLAPRRWGFYLKSKSTNYTDHGHQGDPPSTRKIPMVEPGIEPGTSWLVVRNSDHQTTRLVMYMWFIRQDEYRKMKGIHVHDN